MSKNVVVSLLDSLAVARQAVDAVTQEIDQCIPDALKLRLKTAKDTASNLEDEVKGKARFIPFTTRQTQRGQSLQLVATSKSSLDMQMVEALVLRLGGTLDELEECRKVTKFWSIRKV